MAEGRRVSSARLGAGQKEISFNFDPGSVGKKALSTGAAYFVAQRSRYASSGCGPALNINAPFVFMRAHKDFRTKRSQNHMKMLLCKAQSVIRFKLDFFVF